ncbi:MAG: 16S rRNA processing protein RimM [Desulfobacterales bacterium]|nr:16S rRNA processing protein RimM [Desulfobacterales bacterium]
MNQPSPDSLLLVGKVIRPHGLTGLLRVWAYAGREASFPDEETVCLRSVSGMMREYTITSARFHKNIFLMELEGLRSIEEAEEYRGADILIRKDSLPREEDTYFWHELLGLKVYLDTGEYLGSISRILPTNGNDIYIAKKGDKEVFIPAVHEVVKQIDLENGKIIISAMEGLLDLNEI